MCDGMNLGFTAQLNRCYNIKNIHLHTVQSQQPEAEIYSSVTDILI